MGIEALRAKAFLVNPGTIGGVLAVYYSDALAEIRLEKLKLEHYDTLVALVRQAIPYLADHVAMTPNDGPGDRILMDKCEDAVKRAEEIG